MAKSALIPNLPQKENIYIYIFGPTRTPRACRRLVETGKTHLKLSMQSIPFGSAFENTKQLNAPLNCSPHGPCAIPPKHGQSQFISPVSSLKAPSCEACCSLSSSVSGSVDSGGGVGRRVCSWRFDFTDSRVGRGIASEGLLGGGTATEDLLVLGD